MGTQTEGEDPFLVGVAISVYQNSGGPGTNWERFEKQKNWFGQSVIEGNDRCEQSSDFWNNFESDIARVASLNSNCFRLSLEWSRIEPRRGHFDSEGIARYHAIFDCLDKALRIGTLNGDAVMDTKVGKSMHLQKCLMALFSRHRLKPCVTLHHFVHPMWFEELGAFERAENIPIFVAYAEAAYREFGRRAEMWSTFNEINVMTFCGYLYGLFPPAQLVNFTLAGRHFLHMLQAHAAAYKAIKALPGGASAKIGVVHNYLQYWPLDPKGWSAAYLKPLCRSMEGIWGTDIMLSFFTKGVFEWTPPLGTTLRHKELEIPGCDWIGINYYGRVVLDWKFSTTGLAGETMTDMPFPLYAPGIYDACRAMSALGLPMYITETGVADHKDDFREEMFDTYFAQVEKVVREGMDLRGVMYWTLVDNWEWSHGFHKRFGLYRWSPGDGKNRGEVASTATLAKIYARLTGRMRDLKRAAPLPQK